VPARAEHILGARLGKPVLLLTSNTCSLDKWRASAPMAASTRSLTALYSLNKHVFSTVVMIAVA